MTVVPQILSGLSFGAVLFMLASGLSLVMGVMGTLNLAHGAIYMVGAYVGWSAAVQAHLGFLLACLLAGLAGAALGFVMERGFFRLLDGRPDDQILMSFGFIYILTTLAQLIWGALPKVPFEVAPLTGSVQLGSIQYPFSRVAITGIALLLAGALILLRQRTRLGAVVRAGMDDPQTARALGLRVGAASVAVFVLGSFIAGLGGFLGAPILGATTSVAVDVLLLSLVVVIIGGVGSIAGSLLGSLVIGLAVSFGATLFGGSFGYFAVYLAMVFVLMFRKTGLLAGRTETRATPEPAKRRRRNRLWVLAPLPLVFVPFVLPPYLQSLATAALAYAIFAMSVDLLVGFGGMISLGQAAFFGIGGYAAALVMVRAGISSAWVGIPAAIVVSGVAAAVAGLIALRLGGVYFMLVTFALGQLAYSVAQKWSFLTTGGAEGITFIVGWSPMMLYEFVLAFLVAGYWLLRWVVRSRFGVALSAIRQNEERMRALGYNVWRYRFGAFVIAGMLAGAAGALFAYQSGIVVPATLSVLISGTVVFMVLLGGARTLYGPVIGAVILSVIQYYGNLYLPSTWPLVLGALFVVVAMAGRNGLVGVADRVSRRFGFVG